VRKLFEVGAETGKEEKKAFELKRKFFHLSVVILPILHLVGLPRTIIIIIFTFLVVLIIPLDFYRRKHPKLFLNRFVRKSEYNQMASYIPIIIAGYLLYLTFDWRITTYALFVAALGDAAAAIVGIRYGKHRLPLTTGKSIEGTIGGFLVGLIVVIILDLLDTSGNYPLALLAPLIVVITDLIEDPPNNFLSDNFLNPILCGVYFWLIGIPGLVLSLS